MNKINKIVLYILLAEVQIILLLLVLFYLKTNKIESKITSNQKMLVEILKNNNYKEFQKIQDNDIILGDSAAQLTIFLYTRLDCSACKEFYAETFEEIDKRYIKTGIAKFVMRFSYKGTGTVADYATRTLYYANQFGDAEKYFHLYHKLDFSKTDTTTISSMLACKKNDAHFHHFMNSSELHTRLLHNKKVANFAGIRYTPTMLSNSELAIGTRSVQQVEDLLFSQLESTCN